MPADRPVHGDFGASGLCLFKSGEHVPRPKPIASDLLFAFTLQGSHLSSATGSHLSPATGSHLSDHLLPVRGTTALDLQLSTLDVYLTFLFRSFPVCELKCRFLMYFVEALFDRRDKCCFICLLEFCFDIWTPAEQRQ